VSAVVFDDARAVLNLVERHADRELEDRLDVEDEPALLLGPRERLEPADDLSDSVRAPRRLPCHLDPLGDAGGERPPLHDPQVFEDHVEVRHEIGERIVDLVRDAGRECTHRRHAVGEVGAVLAAVAVGQRE
jgi:hypothetical protein